MQGWIAKLVFWCVTLLGLAPAMVLLSIVLVLCYVQIDVEKRLEPLVRWHEAAPGATFLTPYDSYLKIGPIEVTCYPRLWAATLLGIGIVLVLTGLVALLHVPYRTTQV